MSWLMLITELPSEPAYLRVKLRRRVQRLGAVGLKGAVFLLPDSRESRMQFGLLRGEIVLDGGEAAVCRTEMLDGLSEAAVVARFNDDRDIEYAQLIGACGDLVQRWGNAPGEGDRARLIARRTRLFARLEEVLQRDYFTSARGERAMQAIERVAALR